jgi:sRNA-binding carbon storage regulator CsrA
VLVVSRKENESITIEPADGLDPSLTLRDIFEHGSIVLTLAHVGPRRVRIAIEAPSALKIMRSEAATAGAKPQTEPTPPGSDGAGRP